MRIYANLRAAESFGIARSQAIGMRQRYLTSELIRVNSALLDLAEATETMTVDAINIHVAAIQLGCLAQQKADIFEEIERIKKMTTNPTKKITDGMVESARRYPVERLVEFRHKKATAWCHPDRNPSLCHMTRINKCWCPVCDKYFDPISILMDRDGMGFVDAVKDLSGQGGVT